MPIGIFAVFVAATISFAAEIPSGTTLELRLTQSVSSYSTKKGAIVDGILAAPVVVDNKPVLRIGTRVTGRVLAVGRVGAGLVRETASLTLHFDSITVDGREVRIAGVVSAIDNAREKVDRKGRIRGIRSTGTIAYRTSALTNLLAGADPIAFAFTTVTSSLLLRFSDPEISLPAGTDLFVRTLAPIEITTDVENTVPPLAQTEEERSTLRTLIEGLPFRTMTHRNSQPSDLTNLVFIGTREALEHAFAVAGWIPADPLNAETAYRTFRATAENQGYRSAPMSMLLLDGRPPDYAVSKAFNTFAKRHHARVWHSDRNWKGESVWTASSTQDVGIGFSDRTKTFIHLIDPQIDNERAKVVNDLMLTGCVASLDLVKRPWVPHETRNGTGGSIITDGTIAAVRLKMCESPPESPEPVQFRGPLVERMTRQTVLTVKNNMRENLWWQGYELFRALVAQARKKPQSRTKRHIELNGDDYLVEAVAPSVHRYEPLKSDRKAPADSDARWLHSSRELGLISGWSRLGSNASGGMSMIIGSQLTGGDPSVVSFGNTMRSSWTAGVGLTFNAHRLLSHELTFAYQRGRFETSTKTLANDGSVVASHTQHVGTLTRQFSYNVLFHFRPKESRIRPYVSVGPALQLLHLTDAHPGGTRQRRFGIRSVSILTSAYDFGRRPPLEGGGIFQIGLQYGAGVKIRIAPRWLLRMDFRETLTRQPDFWSKTISEARRDPESAGLEFTRTQLSGPLRQQRVTMGVSFVF